MVAESVGQSFHVASAEQPCCNLQQPLQGLLHCANTSALQAAVTGTRVALQTLVTPGFESEYVAYAAAINAAYARNFGHSFGISTSSSRLENAAAWRAGNVACVLDLLEAGARGAAWVAWLDADAALIDFSRDDALLAAIETYGSASTHILMSRGELIGPGGSSMFNSGFALFRRNKWTTDFLRRWWNELLVGQLNDQEVLERLYKADALGAKRHVVALPRGMFYSEIGDPIARSPKEQHAIHLAGLPNEVRLGVFRHFWKALCAVSTDISPHKNVLRDVYVEELGRFVTERSDPMQGKSSASVGMDVCAKALSHAGGAKTAKGRSCLESAERFSYILRLVGRTAEATVWARGTLLVREQHLGPLDEDTLASRERVAEAAEAEGRNEEAVRFLRQTAEGRARVYGDRGHRAALLTELKLGRLLRRMGRLREAEEPCTVSHELLTRRLGIEHPSALAAAANLADLRLQQQRGNEAETVYRSAATAASRNLGREHSTTLELQQGHVDSLLVLGRADEAVSGARKLLAKRRHTSGVKAKADLGVARTLESLATATEFASSTANSRREGYGKSEDSEKYYREAVEVYAAALGPASQKVLDLRNVAETRQAQSQAALAQARGNLHEAEQWLRRSLQSARPQSAVRAGLANNLGMLLRRGGGNQPLAACAGEAEALLRTAVADFQETSGASAVDYLRAAGNLGDLLRECGRRVEALPLLSTAFDGFAASSSSDAPINSKLEQRAAHPRDALIAESNLALLLFQDGRRDEAEKRYRHVLDRSEAAFGSKSPEATTAREDLFKLLRLRRRHREAAALAAAAVPSLVASPPDGGSSTSLPPSTSASLESDRNPVSSAAPADPVDAVCTDNSSKDVNATADEVVFHRPEIIQNRIMYRIAMPELVKPLKKVVKRLQKAKFFARIYEGVFSYSSPQEWHSKIFVACPEDELVLAPFHPEDHGTLARVRLPDGVDDGGSVCGLARSLKRLLAEQIFPELGLGDHRCAVWETFVNRQVAGGTVAPHVHMDDFFGAVYYLEAPEGTTLAYGNGEPRPAELSDAMRQRWLRRAPTAVVALPEEPQLLHPKAGDLVIFPVGWVKHWVPPIASKGFRTSIVFNTFCV